MGGVKIYEAVKQLTGKRLKEDGIGPINIICGGFPCQDLSGAGQQEGFTGERSSLYTHMLRLIGEVEPEFTIFENVTNLLNGEDGRWFSEFLNDLAKIGQDVEWHCISNSAIGAAHHRDRVWIIAYPNGTNGQGLEFSKPLRSYTEESRRREYTRAVNATLPADDYIRIRENFNDVPREMDSLKAYGNAVNPKIVEIIGNAILNSIRGEK